MRQSNGYGKLWAKRSASAAAAAALLATGAASLAPAATLDQQTCDQLKLEIGQLEGMGVRDNLAKGAVWGKANLRGAQLEQVKKLIEMDETVAFRCPRPKPQPEVQPAAAPGQPKTKVPKKAQQAEAKPGDPKAADPQAKPKPKPKPAAPKSAEGDPPAPAVAQPKPRPPAAKPVDAAPPAPKAAPAQ